MNIYLTEYYKPDGLKYEGPKIEAWNERRAKAKGLIMSPRLFIVGRDANHSDRKTDFDSQPGKA